MTPNLKRVAASCLAISALALGGIQTRESFTDHAIIPVPEDRPTYGFGSTFRPDGSPVQLGDKITRTQADALLRRDIKNKYENAIHQCAGDVLMFPYEFDSLVDLADNIGGHAVCSSSIIPKFRSGDYAAGCAVIKQFKYVQKRDCTLPENYHFCGGIPKDRERVYQMCMGNSKGAK